MAKKKYSRRNRKIEPAVKTLQFSIPGEATTSYIDLSQAASIVNRRFYRQGINWAVAGFTLIAEDFDTGRVTINRLPSSWVVSNSWEKVFRSWKKQQDEVMDDGMQDSVMARYNDFKVFFDQTHYDNTASANLIPRDNQGLEYDKGEWEYSQVVVPNDGAPGVNWQPFLQMLGGSPAGTSPASIGMIQAYANSRATPQSPDPAVPTGVTTGAENVLRRLFDDGDNNDAVLDKIVGKNQNLPYDQDEYPGEVNAQSETVAVMQVTATSIGSMSRARGGSFPCGLLQIQGSMQHDAKLYVHLVPGTHRGYLCEPMTEM